jgi:hypothetical protein
LAFEVVEELALVPVLLLQAAVNATIADMARTPDVRSLRMIGPFLTTSAELDRAK